MQFSFLNSATVWRIQGHHVFWNIPIDLHTIDALNVAFAQTSHEYCFPNIFERLLLKKISIHQTFLGELS